MSTPTDPAAPAPRLAEALAGHIPVAAFVAELAAARGVDPAPTPRDRFAEDASRLSDAEVTPDRTEDLISALVHAGTLTPADGLRLHHRYLKQTAA